tara:strand:+ start:433 stop:597 length:165 start_codon:yes stop_codon:yes gene_type:complete
MRTKTTSSAREWIIERFEEKREEIRKMDVTIMPVDTMTEVIVEYLDKFCPPQHD